MDRLITITMSEKARVSELDLVATQARQIRILRENVRVMRLALEGRANLEREAHIKGRKAWELFEAARDERERLSKALVKLHAENAHLRELNAALRARAGDGDQATPMTVGEVRHD